MNRPILFLFSFLQILCGYPQNGWTQKANFPGPERASPITFCIGNTCYVGTGDDPMSGHPYSDFWSWDSSTNTWTQKKDVPYACESAVGFSIGNKGYILGGTTGYYGSTDPSPIKNYFYEYDPISNLWTARSPLPVTKMSANAFVIGTQAYVIAGGNYNGLTADVWEWDQQTHAWSKKADLPGVARTGIIAFSIGSKGYAGCGIDMHASSGFQDFWEYDPQTDAWTQKDSFPIPLTNKWSFSVGSKGYVGIGGDSANSNHIWQYDPITNAWSFAAPFPGPVQGYMACSNGSKAYVGFPIWPTGDFWEFDPNAVSGIKSTETNSTLSVYPNPASENVVVNCSCTLSESIHFSLKNALGQTVWTCTKKSFASEIRETIDTGNLPKGVYLLELICGVERKTSKVVIE